jgi:DNA mismatch repair protein MutS2
MLPFRGLPMDEHVFNVLEFDRVRVFLAGFAQSAGGRQLCLMTQTATLPHEVRRLQQETTEMRAEIEDSGPLALSGVHPVRNEVQRTRIQNSHLDQLQLLRIAEMLETAATVKALCDGMQEKAPALFRISEPLSDLRPLSKRIRSCISTRGEILDSAGERLSTLRSQLRSLRSGIITRLQKYLQDVDMSFAVQDDFITLRNNRYVIPVRSDRKSAIPGVVHDQSQSRATFFVEPLDILEMNNTLQLTQREAQHEEIRVLIDLSASVHDHETGILNNLSVLEQLDAVQARASLSIALNATEPAAADDSSIELHGCRHPILAARYIPSDCAETEEGACSEPAGVWAFDRDGVVEIDIIKPAGTGTLVLSGANAGGKTVALKTIGLFALMHQSGMHLPAASGGCIPVFENLFADIGDEQNIETSLSTFSAHMTRIKAVITAATPRSLVLLDELGSGTDPAEGGALAAAILDHLRSIGCTTLATSHLALLKNYAFTNTDVENVAVEFDPHTHRPLYRLVYGLPGFSNALSIARGIGIPDSIIRAADERIGSADRQTADLMHSLERSHHALQEKHTRMRDLLESSAQFADMSRRLLTAMQNRREQFLKQCEETARGLLRDAENRLRAIITEHRRRIRTHPHDSRDAESLHRVQQVRQELSRQFPRTQPCMQPLENVDIGQTVTVISLNKKGIVTAVDTGSRRADIDLGAMRVNARFQDLTRSEAQSGRTAHQPPAEARKHPQPEGPTVERQLTVIGMRVADALPLLDKSIDAAVLQGADVLEIIHGRGTGRLMRAIHEHVQNHTQVARLLTDTAQTGLSGITRIELR